MWDRDAPLANQIHKYLICCSQVWACTRLGAAEKPKDEFFSHLLSTFGSPAVAVLTHEGDVSITVASVLMHSPDHRVVIYDDDDPLGARSLYRVIDQIRTASRLSDQTRSICMIPIRKQELLPD